MTLEVKNLDSPDEARPITNGKVEVVNFGDLTVGRTVFEPGWRWSQDVKPIAGTDSCQSMHQGYCIAGRMKVQMDDGQEAEVGAGDAFVISPGHDAWVEGDEPFVGVDFSGMAHYAKA